MKVSQVRSHHASGSRVAAEAIAFALAIGLLALVWLLARPLSLLLAAVVVASALAPLVSWLERWLPRLLAILLVYGLLILGISGVVWLVVPPLVTQAGGVVANTPDLLAEAQDLLDWINTFGDDRVLDTISTTLTGLGGRLVSLPLALLSATLEISLIFVMSIYWLIASPSMLRFALSLVPGSSREYVDSVLREVGHVMGGYVRGVAISGLIVAALTYLGLLVIGVEYALLLALLAGLGELVPILGPVIAAVPALIIALLNSPTQALMVLGFYVALQQLESNVLTPNILHKQADIPPLLVIIAILAGGSIGGILGALIGIPLAGALRVLVLRAVAPAVRRWWGAHEPAAG